MVKLVEDVTNGTRHKPGEASRDAERVEGRKEAKERARTEEVDADSCRAPLTAGASQKPYRRRKTKTEEDVVAPRNATALHLQRQERTTNGYR
jgi:hypothetical protein